MVQFECLRVKNPCVSSTLRSIDESDKQYVVSDECKRFKENRNVR